jgi:hypothetical protein
MKNSRSELYIPVLVSGVKVGFEPVEYVVIEYFLFRGRAVGTFD